MVILETERLLRHDIKAYYVVSLGMRKALVVPEFNEVGFRLYFKKENGIIFEHFFIFKENDTIKVYEDGSMFIQDNSGSRHNVYPLYKSQCLHFKFNLDQVNP